MKLGLQVSSFSWPDAPASIGPTFGRIAQNAEAAGLSSLWVMDHFFGISMIGPPELDMLEGYTALAFAAGQTSRIQLGTLVTGVTYGTPACWSRPSRPSTCSAAAGPGSASARPGTRRSTSGSAFPTRR